MHPKASTPGPVFEKDETMKFFPEIPTADELLGYMAGAVRDCIGDCGSLELEADAMLLWAEFGDEKGFLADRTPHAALDLATRMSACLSAIGEASESHDIRELGQINAIAFAEGHSLLCGDLQLKAA